MQDDQFIREVNEELRTEKLNEFWSKYGKFIIGAAVAIVVAVASFRGYEYWIDSRAAASGDQFAEAIDLSNEGKHDEAIAALQKLGEEGSGQYPALARMRIASELAAKDDNEKAVAEFDAIAADRSYNEAFRNIARLRAGLIMVDEGDFAAVEERLGELAAAGAPFRHSAREGLGLAAYKAGEYEKALDYFLQITNDAESTPSVRTRSRILIELLAGKGISRETS